MARKSNKKKLVKHARVISIIIVSIFLAIYLLTIALASPAFHTEMAARNATLKFEKDMAQVSEFVEAHYGRLNGVVDLVKYANTSEQIKDVFKTYEGDETVGSLRYISQGEVYDYNAGDLEKFDRMDPSVLELAKSNEAGCTAAYYDEVLRLDCIAFFLPVRGSICIDGLISVVPVVDIVKVSEELQENTSALFIVDTEGHILSSLATEEYAPAMGVNIYDYLETLSKSKEDIDSVRNILSGDLLDTFEIASDSIRYTVVGEAMEVFSDHMYLVSLSESENLITVEFDYVSHLVFALVMVILALVACVFFIIYIYKKFDDSAVRMALTDDVLDCPNTEGFIRDVMTLLGKNYREFAVVVYSLQNLSQVEEKFGKEASIGLLKHVKEVIVSLRSEQEAYGYQGDGKFLMFIKFKNDTAFQNRLKIFEGIVNKYPLLKENQIKIRVVAGVYLTYDGKQRPISDMIDCANVVCTDAGTGKIAYEIYTEAVREQISNKEIMESQMELALDSAEFRLFLQPKYNVEKDQIDSAEALVRWFDPQKGDYRYPGEFISLFESNGFIVKMDQYIYLEVLKYLSEAKERGDKVVPISVNVSHVTVASPDFVNFFVGNKNKYQIDDGLITLEFSPSHANEDYQKLSEIITALHMGGIRCSADNFGVAESSFRMLKELQMDELKLDRMFLAKGPDAARDDRILSTVIDLARECGWSVVMGGVENKVMFDRVTQMGIGVIQGYYYAKAISLEEFKIFIKSNTSIRYKAIVK